MDKKAVPLPIVPQISDDLLEQYAIQMLKSAEKNDRIQKVLRKIERIAEENSIPIIGELEGRVIAELITLRSPRPRKVLDIGTAIGYSAIWLASVLDIDGRITSIEMDPARAQQAIEFIAEAGVSEKVEVVVGDVFDILPRLPVDYDIIFQDVMKHVYFAQDPLLARKLLDLCIEHLGPEGLFFTDNAFCQGKVLHESDYNQVKGIQAYNQALAVHPMLSSLLLPFRDGLWLSRRINA